MLQILWNSFCLDSLLFSFHSDLSSAVVHDPAWLATVNSLYQKTVRDWIIISLSHAPCTTQGLLQVFFLQLLHREATLLNIYFKRKKEIKELDCPSSDFCSNNEVLFLL